MKKLLISLFLFSSCANPQSIEGIKYFVNFAGTDNNIKQDNVYRECNITKISDKDYKEECLSIDDKCHKNYSFGYYKEINASKEQKYLKTSIGCLGEFPYFGCYFNTSGVNKNLSGGFSGIYYESPTLNQFKIEDLITKSNFYENSVDLFYFLQEILKNNEISWWNPYFGFVKQIPKEKYIKYKNLYCTTN